MLAPITDLPTLIITRTSWHTIAERVLAPARHAATGRIGLKAAPGGFATPAFGEDRVLAVDGITLIDTNGATSVRHPMTTLGAMAAIVGVDPDAGTGVFVANTPSDTEAPLIIDRTAAATLAGWFAFANDVLVRWRDTHTDATPTEIQLWPEHFDLATDLGPESGRANYGASPGDDDHPLPYVYVGPWISNADPFWNAGSFARLGYGTLVETADPERAVLNFFARGYAIANAQPQRNG